MISTKINVNNMFKSKSHVKKLLFLNVEKVNQLVIAITFKV